MAALDDHRPDRRRVTGVTSDLACRGHKGPDPEAQMIDLIATIKYLNAAFLAAALSTDLGAEITLAILSLI
jgi:hypothetical protein